MRFTLLTLVLALTQYANACYGDYDCHFGAICIKANGPTQAGQCVTGQNGRGLYGNEVQGHAIRACQYDRECPSSYHCEVELGQRYGICTKEQ